MLSILIFLKIHKSGELTFLNVLDTGVRCIQFALLSGFVNVKRVFCCLFQVYH